MTSYFRCFAENQSSVGRETLGSVNKLLDTDRLHVRNSVQTLLEKDL